MRIFISAIINIVLILYFSKISGTEYNILNLINGVVFTFSFGLGLPIIFSYILTFITLLLPGVIVYFLWGVSSKIFSKK